MMNDYILNQVIVTDPYMVNALEKELAYLEQYEEDRLVAGFKETKGLTPKAPKYPGWEETEIRGHTLGHYLTAASQAVKTAGNKKILDKVNYIVDELEECQFESGYLSAFSEQLFDNVEQKKPCWVPWYTMDKIIAGLIAAYTLAGNEKALSIVTKLGNWVYSRTSSWSTDTRNTVLAVEYGGMNEAMYNLYKVTKDVKHAEAAHAFDEETLFEPIHAGKDILNGKHANTTIPKVLGGLGRYIALDDKEEFYLEMAEKFWEMVINNHSYLTGGNSEWEHFGESEILDGERTNCNCETCNTYNMLKLSRELFKITKNKKYADFYENTFMNAIMSSQNPETGMTMYFQPMATGFFKVYSTPFESFWCCTGTGMENFTKLGDSIYFNEDNTIYVNQYISSELNWTEKGIKLTQNSEIPNKENSKFILEGNACTVAFRVPDWASSDITVCKNGSSINYENVNGYVYIELVDGDQLELNIPMTISTDRLPDNKNVIGFKYGPWVLSASLGTEDMEESKTGVDVTIATKNNSVRDFIIVEEGIAEEWIANVQDNFVKEEGKLEFRLKGTDSNELVFTPHFRQHKERYGIYWNIADADSDTLAKYIADCELRDLKAKAEIDAIPLGNDQYELLHNIQGENTGAGTFNGLMLRHAWGENGWFSYDMKVDPSITNYLLIKYFSPNHGRTFNIYVDGELLIEETIENLVPEEFYDKYYELPENMIKGKEKINVKFAVRGDSWIGGLFDKLCIVDKKF